MPNTFQKRVIAYVRHFNKEFKKNILSRNAVFDIVENVLETTFLRYNEYFEGLILPIVEIFKYETEVYEEILKYLKGKRRIHEDFFSENVEVKCLNIIKNSYKKPKEKENENSSTEAKGCTSTTNPNYLKLIPTTEVFLIKNEKSISTIPDEIINSKLLSIDTEFVQDVFRTKAELALIQISSKNKIILLDCKSLTFRQLSSCFLKIFGFGQDQLETSQEQKKKTLMAYSVDSDRSMVQKYCGDKKVQIDWIDIIDFEENYFRRFEENYKFDLKKLGIKRKVQNGSKGSKSEADDTNANVVANDEETTNTKSSSSASAPAPADQASNPTPKFKFNPQNHPNFTKKLKKYYTLPNENPPTKGLSRICDVMLGQKIDKSEQMSNWLKRPLRQEQLEYAALDACCLHRVYEEFLELKEEIPMVLRR